MSDAAAIPLLEIRNATIWRGTTRVFEQLSIRIEQGESLAVIGPNGSGKTTFAKVLTREIYPEQADVASVRLLGRDRFNVRDYRRAVGIVAEDAFELFPPATTVLEAVASAWTQTAGLRGVAARPVGAQFERARELLSEFDLAGLAERSIDSLSSGQRRRAMICRALVTRPAVLILDEPLTGLDLQAACELIGLIDRQVRNGTSLLLITHHIGEIPPAIERIVALQDGRIVADGPKSAVLTSEVLSRLYATPLEVLESRGYFVTVPGGTSGASGA